MRSNQHSIDGVKFWFTSSSARLKRGPPEIARLELLFAAKVKVTKFAVCPFGVSSNNATGLVHEAYLRLLGDQQFDNRGHFFAAAAETMRRIWMTPRALPRPSASSAEFQASDPRFEALDARLNAFANGEPAQDNAERLALAQRAYDTRRFALAARLFGEALESDPTLADDRDAQHRYNSACAASRAAAGQGQNEPPLDDEARTVLRNKTLDWLTAELATWSTLLESGPSDAKGFIAQTLKHWQQDSDLAGIRDASELARLPESERAAWEVLWKNVDELLTKASAETKSGDTR